MNWELPDGWEWVKLGNVAFFQPGIGFPLKYQGLMKGDYPFVKVGDISNSIKIGKNLMVVI